MPRSPIRRLDGLTIHTLPRLPPALLVYLLALSAVRCGALLWGQPVALQSPSGNRRLASPSCIAVHLLSLTAMLMLRLRELVLHYIQHLETTLPTTDYLPTTCARSDRRTRIDDQPHVSAPAEPKVPSRYVLLQPPCKLWTLQIWNRKSRNSPPGSHGTRTAAQTPATRSRPHLPASAACLPICQRAHCQLALSLTA